MFVVKFVVKCKVIILKNNDVFDHLAITCPQTLCDVLNLALLFLPSVKGRVE